MQGISTISALVSQAESCKSKLIKHGLGTGPPEVAGRLQDSPDHLDSLRERANFDLCAYVLLVVIRAALLYQELTNSTSSRNANLLNVTTL